MAVSFYFRRLCFFELFLFAFSFKRFNMCFQRVKMARQPARSLHPEFLTMAYSCEENEDEDECFGNLLFQWMIWVSLSWVLRIRC